MMVAGDHVPVMPLIDLTGRAGGALFWQSGPIWVNVGVIAAVTLIFIVAGAAHGSGEVKVYVVVPVFAVLIAAGLQVPVKPLIEVAGRAGGALF